MSSNTRWTQESALRLKYQPALDPGSRGNHYLWEGGTGFGSASGTGRDPSAMARLAAQLKWLEVKEASVRTNGASRRAGIDLILNIGQLLKGVARAQIVLFTSPESSLSAPSVASAVMAKK